MFSTSDTIVAIATPPGRGGIGIVRLSGPDATSVVRALVSHPGELVPRHATFTTIRVDDRAIDQAVVTYFPAPHSYTGDDVIELSAHGSPVVLRAIVAAAMAAGARHADPGEFTLRAFCNGRIDLVQAEAVADLVDAVTPLQARAAFDQLEGTLTATIAALDAMLFDLVAKLEASVDFPDEGYHFVEPDDARRLLDRLCERTATLLAEARRGRIVREGLTVAIVGKPNVGKSSLFNALVGAARAIVTEVPGTTRDLVAEVVDVDGLRVTLVDTAGLRETVDPIEVEGVARTRGAQATADLVLEVFDRSIPRVEESVQTTGYKRLTVLNKTDLPAAWSSPHGVCVSARTGQGLDDLRRAIGNALDVDPERDRPEITNARHATLVERAHVALLRARAAIESAGGSLSEEFILADLQDARGAFEEITGRRTADDLLEHIFSRFCVGK